MINQEKVKDEWVSREIDKCCELLVNGNLKDIEKYHINKYFISLQKLI
jgi:hypothetical protein